MAILRSKSEFLAEMNHKFGGQHQIQQLGLQEPRISLFLANVSKDDFFGVAFKENIHDQYIKEGLVDHVEALQPIRIYEGGCNYKKIRIYPRQCGIMHKIMKMFSGKKDQTCIVENFYKDPENNAMYIFIEDIKTHVPFLVFKSARVLIQVKERSIDVNEGQEGKETNKGGDKKESQMVDGLEVSFCIEADVEGKVASLIMPFIYEKLVNDFSMWLSVVTSEIREQQKMKVESK